MAETALKHQAKRPEIRSLTVPWEVFKRAEDRSVLMAFSSFDFNKGKLFSTNSLLTFQGLTYMVQGGCYSKLESTYRDASLLVPEAAYKGPTFTVPAHQQIGNRGNSITLPGGIVRYRGCDKGMLVLVNRQRMVLADSVRLYPRLPTSVLKVTEAEAQAYHYRNAHHGWRGLWSDRYHSPFWTTYRGVTVATYGADDGDDLLLVHGQDEKGAIFEVTIRSTAAIDELLAEIQSGVQVVAQSVQMGLF